MGWLFLLSFLQLLVLFYIGLRVERWQTVTYPQSSST